jgi:hypothetical protein
MALEGGGRRCKGMIRAQYICGRPTLFLEAAAPQIELWRRSWAGSWFQGDRRAGPGGEKEQRHLGDRFPTDESPESAGIGRQGER